MKKKITNAVLALAIVAGLALSVIAPWWVVWLVILPAIWAAAIALLKLNTNNIEYYG